MRCPNKNDEEWKALVDRVGEFEAYLMYIDNDYNIPSEKEGFKDNLYEDIDERLTDELIKANEVYNKSYHYKNTCILNQDKYKHHQFYNFL